jgi:hypothetical protein
MACNILNRWLRRVGKKERNGFGCVCSTYFNLANSLRKTISWYYLFTYIIHFISFHTEYLCYHHDCSIIGGIKTSS